LKTITITIPACWFAQYGGQLYESEGRVQNLAGGATLVAELKHWSTVRENLIDAGFAPERVEANPTAIRRFTQIERCRLHRLSEVGSRLALFARPAFPVPLRPVAEKQDNSHPQISQILNSDSAD
jgi:hypothetical protein